MQWRPGTEAAGTIVMRTCAGQTMYGLEIAEAGAHNDDVTGVRWIAQCSVASDLNRGDGRDGAHVIEPLIDRGCDNLTAHNTVAAHNQ
jgi:hypothetical protein